MDKEEKIVGGLLILSLVLMATYVFIRLVILKKPTVFLQSVPSCQLSSCQECDLDHSGYFESKEVTALKYLLNQAQCPQEETDASLSWCLSHCQVSNKPKEQYHCKTTLYTDKKCVHKDYTVEFPSSTDKSKDCTPTASGSQIIDCQLTK